VKEFAMRGKILFSAGLAVGYVFGTRAGRERYEQLKRTAESFWNSPRVKHRVDQVEDFVKEKAPEVAEFVSDGAKQLVNQVVSLGVGRKKDPASAKATPGPKKASGAKATSARATNARATSAKPAAAKASASRAKPSSAASSGTS
jgi:hypothetical protein